MFGSKFAYAFRLSVSMRKFAGKDPFFVLIYMNSYIFHICFLLFILLSYLIFDFVCLTLSSADTHGIVKYARTYIRDTHTHANTKLKKTKLKRLEKKVGKPKKKRWEARKENKKKKRKDEKKRGEKKEENKRKRRGGKMIERGSFGG